MVAVEPWTVDYLERVVRRAARSPISRGRSSKVSSTCSRELPSDESLSGGRVSVGPRRERLRSREGGHASLNQRRHDPGPRAYGVFLVGAEPGKGRVGELDEEMVFETRQGETFMLGASTWRVEEITHDRVLVSPAPGVPGKMPFWKGETAARPLEFGRAIGALTRSLRASDPAEGTRRLIEKHDLDERAARNLLQYLADQSPSVARPLHRLSSAAYLDEWGLALCVLTPFGVRCTPLGYGHGAMAREAPSRIMSSGPMTARRAFPERPAPRPASRAAGPRSSTDLSRALSATPLFAALSARLRVAPCSLRAAPGQPLAALAYIVARRTDAVRRVRSCPIILEAYASPQDVSHAGVIESCWHPQP